MTDVAMSENTGIRMPGGLAGERAVLDPEGALWLPDHRLLVVSDLHLEKGSAFAERGIYLPPYDSRATLLRLRALCERLQPQSVIALGDSFHDAHAPGRLDGEDVDVIRRLTGAHDWIWIAGNHDPTPPTSFGGRVTEEMIVGALTFRHEPLAGAARGEVAGHLHPAASVRARGRKVRRRCFASDGTRLVMPAFGAYAGGLCVLNTAFHPLFAEGFQAFVLGRGKVYPVASEKLVPDQSAGGGGGMMRL